MAKKEAPPPTPEEEAAQQVKLASMAEAIEDYDGFVQSMAQTIWQYDELPFDLNVEDQLFVRSYIIDRNPVATMRRLGHVSDDAKKLKARAQRHLAKTEVQSAIEFLAKRMMEKLDITAEKVQRAVAAVAFFDVRQIATFDKYGIDLLHSRFWTEEQALAIQSLKMGQHGIELKMYDRMKGLEMLSKQLGLQPEDDDRAEAARRGAEEAMAQIGRIIDRVFPGDDAKQALPAPDEDDTPAEETRH